MIVGLSSRAQRVMEELTGEGPGNLKLYAVAVLAVPLWALSADQQAIVAGLCEHSKRTVQQCSSAGPSGVIVVVANSRFADETCIRKVKHVWSASLGFKAICLFSACSRLRFGARSGVGTNMQRWLLNLTLRPLSQVFGCRRVHVLLRFIQAGCW